MKKITGKTEGQHWETFAKRVADMGRQRPEVFALACLSAIASEPHRVAILHRALRTFRREIDRDRAGKEALLALDDLVKKGG